MDKWWISSDNFARGLPDVGYVSLFLACVILFVIMLLGLTEVQNPRKAGKGRQTR